MLADLYGILEVLSALYSFGLEKIVHEAKCSGVSHSFHSVIGCPLDPVRLSRHSSRSPLGPEIHPKYQPAQLVSAKMMGEG